MLQSIGFLLTLSSSTTAAGVYDVTAYGAVGDGIHDDTAAVAAALKAAAAAAPPTKVLFPLGGTFLTGPINMSSSMTLQVQHIDVLF